MRMTAAGLGVLFSLMVSNAGADVVVVVSAQNPVETLSRAELTDIYLGRMNRFPNGTPVTPIDQREGTPTHSEFYRRYLGQAPAQIKAHWSKLIFTGRGQPPKAVSSDDTAADIVAESPHAIGYLAPDFVDDRLRVVAIE